MTNHGVLLVQVHQRLHLNMQPSSWHAQLGAQSYSDFVYSMSHRVHVALPLSHVTHVQHNSKVSTGVPKGDIVTHLSFTRA